MRGLALVGSGVLLAALSPAADAPDQVPASLRALQAAASDVHKSRITFAVTTRKNDTWSEAYYYENLRAGEQEILKDRGVLSQYGRKDEDGDPLPSTEQWSFYDGTAVWSYHGDEYLVANCSDEPWLVADRARMFLPLLQAGSYPYASAEYSASNFTRAHPGLTPQYAEHLLADGVYQVEARFEDGNLYRWWIDPSKGWNCVRCERHYNDKLSAYCLAEYRQINGAWVVQSVNYFTGDGRPTAQLKAEKAAVNDPALPDRLTARDAGLVPGQTVYLTRAGTKSARVWNGTGVCSAEEFKRMEDAGQVKFDPVLREQIRLKNKRAAKAEAADPARHAALEALRREFRERGSTSAVDGWILYAQKFSDNYRLLDEQRAVALRIVKHLLPQKQKIVVQVRPFRDSKAEKDQARVREGEEKIQRIFDEELKPRLMKIPSRAQIEDFEKRQARHEKAPTSSPAP